MTLTLKKAGLDFCTGLKPNRDHLVEGDMRREAIAMDIIHTLLLLGCCITLQQFGMLVDAAEGEWDYGRLGPQTDAWCRVSDVCCTGTKQSPINLDLALAKFGVTGAFNFIDYDKSIYLVGVNNGHSAMFSQDPRSYWGAAAKPRISGGGLNGTYTLHSFHFHWGKDSSVGSEHLDNGFPYAAEAHFVHYRSDFANLGAATASGQPNAIAVLGVFYGVGKLYNQAINDLTMSLEAIAYPERSVKLRESLRLIDLLPYNKASMYRYFGSLTTPGCDEVVVWTVFTDPQYLSEEQIRRFRDLFDEKNMRLLSNFRPLQSLGKRELFRLEARSGGNINNVVIDDGARHMDMEFTWP